MILIAPVKVLLLLSVSAVTFWSQAVITEDRFIPALNILSHHWNINQDVAAATLMAAGSASPNLLAVVVSLFITKSTLGIGTIIGSEMFQQLFCVSAAILSVRKGHGGKLALSPLTTGREIFFYALSLVLLRRALTSDLRAEGDDEEIQIIYISIWDGLSLLLAYVFYVVLCVNFDKLVGKVAGNSEGQALPSGGLNPNATRSQSDLDPMAMTSDVDSTVPFLRQLRYEPGQNFEMAQARESMDSLDDVRTGSFHYQDADSLSDSDGSKSKGSGRFRAFLCVPMPRIRKDNRHSRLHDLDDIEINDGSMSCFLWQESLFYDHTSLASRNAWQLRWFTFYFNGSVSSVPDRIWSVHDRGLMVYPAFESVQIDRKHLTLRFRTAQTGPEYVCMAPCQHVLLAVMQKSNGLHMSFSALDEAPQLAPTWAETFEDMNKEGSPAMDLAKAEMDGVPSLIEYPEGSYLTVAIHVVLFPIKWLMHITIPDVRKPSHGTKPELMAALSTVSSIVWLIVNSIAMVSSLEHVAHLVNVPENVVGVTLSAVGTSIPICVASVVSARKGLGNAAVANALGSNTFNILVGLGLPWTLYAAIYGDYHGMTTRGIDDTILVVSLMVFVLMLFWGKFVLNRYHAVALGALYVAYVVYSVVTGTHV